ncbi:MAG TPA: hypothetical protein VHC63_01175 [Acidimicrobiales bacterium]|nr:hypothetical protein [Acidimicrobiales bacterium]
MKKWALRVTIALVLVAAGVALWAYVLHDVKWDKPFAAGILGATLGAIAGGVGVGLVTLLFGGRIERRERRKVRSEAAVLSLLELLDGDHLTALNAASLVLSRWADGKPTDPFNGDARKLTAAFKSEAVAAFSPAKNALQSVRVLASRIDDDAFLTHLGQYTTLALVISLDLEFGNPDGALENIARARLVIRDLAVLGNEALGHKAWTPNGDAECKPPGFYYERQPPLRVVPGTIDPTLFIGEGSPEE